MSYNTYMNVRNTMYHWQGLAEERLVEIQKLQKVRENQQHQIQQLQESLAAFQRSYQDAAEDACAAIKQRDKNYLEVLELRGRVRELHNHLHPKPAADAMQQMVQSNNS